MMRKEKTAGKEKTVGTLFTGDDLKKLIFPLIVEQILAVSVGMVDTMMVSSAGEAATSGVSLVDIINVLIINIFAAFRISSFICSKTDISTLLYSSPSPSSFSIGLMSKSLIIF